MSSGRVPSYKAIALCILKNDLVLKGIGFEGRNSDWYGVLKAMKVDKKQLDLFRAN